MKAALARKTVGAGSLWIFAVTASSPMTVMAGGVVATFALTGTIGVPLSFLVLAVALTPLTVAYISAVRHIPHAAGIYAVLAHGLSPAAAVSGAAVALVAYNSIQICLYGLLGALVSGLLGGQWWLWAGVAWTLVAMAGVLHVRFNATVIGAVLACQIVLIGWYDVHALLHPAGHISLTGLDPAQLFGRGFGGVMAFGIAAYIGYESATTYSEEARSPGAVSSATYLALGFLGVFYTVSAWAMTVSAGPDHILAAANDPTSGLPFAALGHNGALFASGLVVAAVLACMLSFHNGIARYVFALGREHVLPERYARIRTGSRGGAPIGGSLLQSSIAAAVIALSVIGHIDPYKVVFTWLGTLAAFGVMSLLLVAAVASARFFAKGGGRNEGVFVRRVAPVLGVATGGAILVSMVANLSGLLGLAPDSPLRFLLPGIIVGSAVAGLGWAAWLKERRPEAFALIGRGRPHPLAIPDHRLVDVVL